MRQHLKTQDSSPNPLPLHSLHIIDKYLHLLILYHVIIYHLIISQSTIIISHSLLSLVRQERRQRSTQPSLLSHTTTPNHPSWGIHQTYLYIHLHDIVSLNSISSLSLTSLRSLLPKCLYHLQKQCTPDSSTSANTSFAPDTCS